MNAGGTGGIKVRKPYHGPDRVLNIALDTLAGGTYLEDLELRRRDVAYLDSLGAKHIPDPTTAGEFIRRFGGEKAVLTVMEPVNAVRPGVWAKLPRQELRQGILDTDGTIAPTTGEQKRGKGLSYNGVGGFHPLVLSLANTREVLYLPNRPGNVPSREGAAEYMDRAIALAGKSFDEVWLRGDTNFSLTAMFVVDARTS